MKDFIHKIDNDNSEAGVVIASEYNSLFNENKNVVKAFLELSDGDEMQMVKSVNAMSKSLVYEDVGVKNNVVLTRNNKLDSLEVLFDGMVFLFKPKFENTGSATLKVASTPIKTIKNSSGNELVGGELKTNGLYVAVYKDDEFRINKLLSLDDEGVDSNEVVITPYLNNGYRRKQFDKNREFVTAKDFGAIGDGNIHILSERYADLDEARGDYPSLDLKSLKHSIDWCAIQEALNSFSSVYIDTGVYLLSDGLVLNGQKMRGAGVDMWDNLDANPTLKSQERGTHLLFYGVGARDKFLGLTNSNKKSGGHVINNDSTSARTSYYRLHSFLNENGTQNQKATNKLFSSAIHIQPYSYNTEIKDLRIVPEFDGIEGYKTREYAGLGSDWDVGIFNDNGAFTSLINVQCVGYWRITSSLNTCTNDKDYLDTFAQSSAGRMYHSHYDRCVFQGMVGMMFRAGSRYPVLSITSDTIGIPFDEEHPFNSSGQLETPKGRFEYDGIVVIDDIMKFQNVTPSPTGDISLVRIGGGVGMGGATVSRTLVTGLDHSSSMIASEVGFDIGVSKALEIDMNGRNIAFNDCYIQSREEVLIHMGSIGDLKFVNGQWESNNYKVSGGQYADKHGGRVIALYHHPDAVSVSKFRLDGTHVSPQVDLFPYRERTHLSKFTDDGLFNPSGFYYSEYNMPHNIDELRMVAMDGQAINTYVGKDSYWQIRNKDSEDLLTLTQAGNLALRKGALSLNGVPISKNSIGSTSNKFNVINGMQYAVRNDFENSPNDRNCLGFFVDDAGNLRLKVRMDDNTVKSGIVNLS